MALQNSGKITLDQVGREYRGAKPYKMQDHYRGGSRVPSNIPGNYSPGNPGYTIPGQPATCNSNNWTALGPANETNFSCMSQGPGDRNPVGRTFSGSGYVVSGIAQCSSPVGMSNTCGGVSFNAGPWPGVVNNAKKNNGTMNSANPPTTNRPNPPTGNPAVAINTRVPTSGTIKLSNFYGGRKS